MLSSWQVVVLVVNVVDETGSQRLCLMASGAGAGDWGVQRRTADVEKLIGVADIQSWM